LEAIEAPSETGEGSLSSPEERGASFGVTLATRKESPEAARRGSGRLARRLRRSAYGRAAEPQERQQLLAQLDDVRRDRETLLAECGHQMGPYPLKVLDF
jgi:hypothetical protein